VSPTAARVKDSNNGNENCRFSDQHGRQADGQRNVAIRNDSAQPLKVACKGIHPASSGQAKTRENCVSCRWQRTREFTEQVHATGPRRDESAARFALVLEAPYGPHRIKTQPRRARRVAVVREAGERCGSLPLAHRPVLFFNWRLLSSIPGEHDSLRIKPISSRSRPPSEHSFSVDEMFPYV
jgi:hypothetical protein